MPGHFDDPPPPPLPKPGSRHPVESHRDHRLRHDAQPSWNLRLESTGGNLPARFLAESPAAAELVTEDLCWQAATEDWKHRRPRWWRLRARAAWKAEGVGLGAWAGRLRKAADHVFQQL